MSNSHNLSQADLDSIRRDTRPADLHEDRHGEIRRDTNPRGVEQTTRIVGALGQQQAQQVPARTQLLNEATRITAQDRNSAYGNPEDNFQNIANYWNTYLTTIPKQGNILPLTSQDVAHLMILMKMARLNTNPSHRDSLVDIAGYAACGEDCRTKRVGEVHKVGFTNHSQPNDVIFQKGYGPK